MVGGLYTWKPLGHRGVSAIYVGFTRQRSPSPLPSPSQATSAAGGGAGRWSLALPDLGQAEEKLDSASPTWLDGWLIGSCRLYIGYI